MRRFVTLLLVSAVAIALITPARGLPIVHRKPTHKKVSLQTIEDLEEQWSRAQLNGDVDAMEHLLSEDYVGISSAGVASTKAQQLARMRDRKVTFSRFDLSDIKIKLKGQIAIVTSRGDIAGTNDSAPIDGVFYYTRVYERLPGGVWKITSFESTRVPKRNQPGDPAAAPKP